MGILPTVSVLLYGCTTWTLMKCLKKKLDRDHIRMPYGVLNKSCKHHLGKQQLYGHLPPISQTIEDMLGTAGEIRTNS